MLFCAGKSQSSFRAIERIRPESPKTAIRVFGFKGSADIKDLLAHSSVLISKSGGSSIAEAISQKTPILFHAKSAWLPWEKMNQEWIVENRMGQKIRGGEDLVEQILEAVKMKNQHPSPWKAEEFPTRFLDWVKRELHAAGRSG